VTNLYHLSPGERAPEIVTAVIEVPLGSSNKYEYDAEHGVFKLDRVLYSPMHYPGDYGFIPGTYADDDDPLDVLVLMNKASFTGAVMRARPTSGSSRWRRRRRTEADQAGASPTLFFSSARSAR
jgi:inorganic pyrophosphatase